MANIYIHICHPRGALPSPVRGEIFIETRSTKSGEPVRAASPDDECVIDLVVTRSLGRAQTQSYIGRRFRTFSGRQYAAPTGLGTFQHARTINISPLTGLTMR